MQRLLITFVIFSCNQPSTQPACRCAASPAAARAHPAMVYALVSVDEAYSPPVNASISEYSMRVLQPRRSDLSSVLFGTGRMNVRLHHGELFVAEINTEHPHESCFECTLGATQGDVTRMFPVSDETQGMEELAKISRSGWQSIPSRDIRPSL